MTEHSYSRRGMLGRLGATAAASVIGPAGVVAAPTAPAVTSGAARLAAEGFRSLVGLRVGLITNQTGRIAEHHLVDLMVAAPGLKLTKIFAPEHGFRGVAEAGAKVANDRDARTGIPIVSLYGATKAPTQTHLRDLDVLVFDIQDIGARFYTYISTMGLAMQAAARRGIPFVVLDRPNPLGGNYSSGFVLEPKLRSFVGQYPLPIVHGLTVGELADMIQGERWLAGLDRLDLRVVTISGWTRAMRFLSTGLPWVPTSPNIPTYNSALLYPGVGIIGETVVNEGRGTPIPFQQFGAPWLDAMALARDLTSFRLPGVAFEVVRYVPVAITDVAANPRFRGETVNAVRVRITDVDRVEPLELGLHALGLITKQAGRAGLRVLPDGAMFHAIAGTTRLKSMLERGASGAAIIAAWDGELSLYGARRTRYLRY